MSGLIQLDSALPSGIFCKPHRTAVFQCMHDLWISDRLRQHVEEHLNNKELCIYSFVFNVFKIIFVEGFFYVMLPQVVRGL